MRGVKRRTVLSVQKALEAHTERRSVEDLAKSGKRHVRVVSGDKVLCIIQDIVDAAISQEATHLAKKDRDRVVAKVKEKFDRIQHLQSEADAEVHKLKARLRKREDLESDLRARLAVQKEALAEHERERVRLLGQVEDDARVLKQLRTLLTAKTAELAGVQTRLAELKHQQARAADIGSLRGDLNELKAALSELGTRPAGPDAATVEALVKQIAERDGAATKELEERFQASLDHTLDEIGKTLKAATASPIDNPVEATEVLINKLFDHEDDMESNYEQLEIAERRSKASIKGPLDALRAMRRKTAGGGSEENDKKARLSAKAKNNMKLLKELKAKQKS
ncbi:MAG: hypothetical protein O7E54_06920 [Planctomycetota bacterium]|nr:hypothetical protein [Planctomycetota bacterium]